MTLVEYRKKERLVTITLNRPEKLNALSRELLEELRGAWLRYRDDDDAWVAILTGAGSAFSAGADKSWFAEALDGQDSLGRFLDAVLRDPYWSGELDKPTIVAVNGYAIGAGFDLVLRADLRVAGESATFQLPEVERGNIVPVWDNLPYAITAEIVSGFTLTAQRAYDVGMINRVVPDEQLLDAATELAEALLSRPPLVLQHALGTLRERKNSGALVSTNLLRLYTTAVSKELTKTEDGREAAAALLEKRKPVFRKR